VLEVITPTEVRLTISEGRYHQVKRMFAAVGNHVVGLHRERIGDIRWMNRWRRVNIVR
jgi:16S rRNA pseudouridine516 synthase